MTRHDLAIAKWKCSFLAKNIVILRQSDPKTHVLNLFASHQHELDLLLAAIAKTHEAKDWAAAWVAKSQTEGGAALAAS